MSNTEIFVSIWGYEQTNVSFFQVIKRTAKTVTVREINAKIEETDYFNYEAMPDVGNFIGEPMRRTLQNCLLNAESIRINSFMHAHTWNGCPQHGNTYY